MIRQFWLTNENGEEYDLRAHGTSMLSNPKNTAEGLGSRSYWQGKRTFVQTAYNDTQSTITANINFTSPERLTEFELYIHRSDQLFLHILRSDVPERYAEVECVITDRPEDAGKWVMAAVSFRRLSPWRNPAKTITKTVSSVQSIAFQKPGNGSLPSAFVLKMTPSASYTGTISVSDGTNTFAVASLTVVGSDTLAITCIEGEQSVYNDSTDVYNKIDFSTSSFFELIPGADLTITTGASFTGDVTLEIYDQWNEA